MINEIDVSIIVVAWNVEAYIAQAVASCIGQSLKNIEIIVVENGSTDGTRGVIEAVIAGHPNAIIVPNDSNIGLGPARNQGIAMAHGEYIAFLDGDDWLEPRALELAFNAAKADDADVVIFDHSLHHQNGRVDVAHNKKWLGIGLCKSFEDREAASRTFGVAWNKLYRRAFILGESFTFSNSYYEDIDWTYPILMVAPRVTTLPKALVNYRCRDGSILRSQNPRHFEVIERWQSVLEFLRNNDRTVDPGWHRLVGDRLSRQLESVIASPFRAGFAERCKFARAAHNLVRKIDPDRKLKFNFGRQIRYNEIWRGHIKLAVLLIGVMKWGAR